jgi:SAM-dependent methyltransferase
MPQSYQTRRSASLPWSIMGASPGGGGDAELQTTTVHPERGPLTDPTSRFSSRVEDYVRYRPGYPDELMDLLAAECGLAPAWTVADVGAGTGILTELFLKNGNPVLAVEPNEAMRGAGEDLLSHYPNYTSVAGTAERTTLAGGSVDLVAAGQALHWFDAQASRAEFERVLRGEGWVAFVWNDVRAEAPLAVDYETLRVCHGTDYEQVGRHEGGRRVVERFFEETPYETRTLENHQVLDLAGFKGRLASSSYVPSAGEPGFEAMMEDAGEIFARHASAGAVVFPYDTKVYYGTLRGGIEARGPEG